MRLRITLRDLLPLVIVLPLMLYAYMFQGVIAQKTLENERSSRTQYLKSISNRLSNIAKGKLLTCGDYSHWNETCNTVANPGANKEWIDTNLNDGIGGTFGFDIAILQNTRGDTIWAKSFDSAMLSDLSSYGLLRQCRNKHESAGLICLGGRTYIYAATAVLSDQEVGKSRGMLFAATSIDKEFLKNLNAGIPHYLAYCEKSGQQISTRKINSPDNLPPAVVRMMVSNIVPTRIGVAESRDQKTSYGYLPILDVNGRPIGMLLDVASREGLVANMVAVKRMSVAFMLLCLLIGVAGAIYIRTRELALRAHKDVLTGLFNHGYLQDHLKMEVLRARRYNHPLSVLMVDIDHFKVVNDTYGHAVGDRVLKSLSSILTTTLRETDLVARYGGEEFAIVLPETDLYWANTSAERLRLAVEQDMLKGAAASNSQIPPDLHYTISIGVATFPEDAQESADLLGAADAALAGAKRTRNTVTTYQGILSEKGTDLTCLPVVDGFMRDFSISVVRPLVAAIDTRDPGSVRHSEKVAEYAVAIGREMGLSTQDLSMLCKAALVHDVGKLGIPDSVLTKKGRLSAEEMEIVKRHSRLGADIVSQSPQLAPVAELVLHHQEWYDGRGYPDGLAGEEIPEMARILATADALDAMTSPRSYRQPIGLAEALLELRKGSGKQFDPKIVDAAAAVIGRMLDIQKRGEAA